MHKVIELVSKLTAFREKWESKRPRWGRNDCVLMAHDWVKTLQPKADLPNIPKYKCEETAVRALKSLGADNLADLLDSVSCLERVSVGEAWLGDIVEVSSDNSLIKTALTIQIDADLFLVFTKDGFQKVGFGVIYSNDFAFTGNAWRVKC